MKRELIEPAYLICVPALLGVVLRPWRLPEVLWSSAGAVALVLAGLVPPASAAAAVARGADVYLFLLGMMLLAAVAEQAGLFDAVAVACVRLARGSPQRLFTLVYAAGVVVTVFLSNDATAVVLTPAVLAVTRRARIDPLPCLLACALVANAASFVLPLSNPANLVVFAAHLPALLDWLARFALPSVLSVAATYGVLRWRSRQALSGRLETAVQAAPLAPAARIAAGGIVLVSVVLLGASAFGISLGAPTLICAVLVWLLVSGVADQPLGPALSQISWSVLPLVAGLFVIVEGLHQAGLLTALRSLLHPLAQASPVAAALGAGATSAVAANLMNNLPAGLIAGQVVGDARFDMLMRSAVAIGIDLGPNLSVTGSLATILWLVALRRQGIEVSAWTFLKTGLVVMPAALLASFAGLWIQSA